MARRTLPWCLALVCVTYPESGRYYYLDDVLQRRDFYFGWRIS
jgi:hypothetical protein